MKIFTIDSENSISVYADAKAAAKAPDSEVFRSEQNLAELAANWPGSRLVEVWNGIPGVVPVKKFTNRKIAVERIWKAIQSYEPVAEATNGTRKRKEKPVVREGSKTAQAVALLRAREGATLTGLMKALKWQKHSVRGFVSGTLIKKMGLDVESFRNPEGERAYRIRS